MGMEGILGLCEAESNGTSSPHISHLLLWMFRHGSMK